MAKIASALLLVVALSFSAQITHTDLHLSGDVDGRTSSHRLNERYGLLQPIPSPVSAVKTVANAAGAGAAVAVAVAVAVADPSERLPKINVAERKKYEPLIKRVARRYDVDEALIHAVISTESAYDAYAVSPRGASGLMQLMPDTAEHYGVVDVYDPRENVVAGTKHLRYLMKIFDNDVALALAAYNAGQNTVRRYGRTIPPFPETRVYVPRALGYYHKYQAEI